jgi:hypothetical protein
MCSPALAEIATSERRVWTDYLAAGVLIADVLQESTFDLCSLPAYNDTDL